jgi:hypothetical protein
VEYDTASLLLKWKVGLERLGKEVFQDLCSYGPFVVTVLMYRTHPYIYVLCIGLTVLC